MVKYNELKKELKQIKRDIRHGKNTEENRELRDILSTEINLKKHLRTKGYHSKLFDKISDSLKEYDPEIKLLKYVKYVGHKIFSIHFTENKFDKRHFTVKTVQKISDKISTYLVENKCNGLIGTALIYPSISEWRGAKLTEIGNPVSLYSPQDSGYEGLEEPNGNVPRFNVYVILKEKAEGGSDKYNDCLYYCLNEIIPNFKSYYSSPSDFKTQLKVNRFDRVPLEKIILVEKKLRTIQINVRGDHIYTSQIKSNKSVNLLLNNQHFEIDTTLNKKPLAKNIRYKEKQILLVDKKTLNVCDGMNSWIISIGELNKIKYDFQNKYIIVDRMEWKDKTGNIIKYTIEEEYKLYVEIAKDLKTKSNGIINLFKTGNFISTSLDLFERMSKHINEPENILQDEVEWLEYVKAGALIFSEPFIGELFKYDVKSLYPYLMIQNYIKFPVKRGEFKTIEILPSDYFQYGIYRCVISPSSDKNINKLFRFNRYNYYTHFSLEHAKTLNLKIELINDSKPNFLFYDGNSRMTMKEVFEPFVNTLFELKDKHKLEAAKNILNKLWGALCETEKTKYFNDNKSEIVIPNTEDIIMIYPDNSDESKDIITTRKRLNPYKTKYARLGCFLLSKARLFMSNLMYSHRNEIKRCQTDGFFTTKSLHFNSNVSIGELKFETHYKNGQIINSTNKVLEV